ncbi:Fic family protein [Isoptericola chiayiensis]|nr:Fic family protein [Isoptericola chiayiensis]NOV99530.1 Fic family protein [Isoptericola chiayiensis]
MPDVEGLWMREEQAPDLTAHRASDRRGGSFLRYHPRRLAERMVPLIDADTMEKVADASVAVARTAHQLRQRPVAILHATLLRSESISSSWVEGLRETPRNIMVAQLRERDPGLAGHQFDRLRTASSILANLNSVRDGVELLRAPWTHDAIHAIHRTIAPAVHDDGYRVQDVQIGGSSKLTASYAAPPAAEVPWLMDDLLTYANVSPDAPLVKSAIIHAQFETVHPYEDGNGRAGRVLVHGYLARAGVLDHGVLPLSVVLRRDVDEYVRRLMAYRHASDDDRPGAVAQFVDYFADCLVDSCEETDRVMAESEEVRADWADRVSGYRSDSAVHRALPVVADQPVLTARYLASALGVSTVTGRRVVDQLLDAGIVEPSGGRFNRSEVYQASALLRMMDRLVPGIQPTALPRPRPVRPDEAGS